MTDLSKLTDEQLQTLYAGQQAAVRHGVDPAFVQRVMAQESNYNPSARSPVGAIGSMQLMPGTARDLGVDPNNPTQNIDGGVRYLRQQLDTFKGDQRLAAAAYNAGPGRVQRVGGIPNIPETQRYVATVAPLDLSGMSDDELKAAYEQSRATAQPRAAPPRTPAPPPGGQVTHHLLAAPRAQVRAAQNGAVEDHAKAGAAGLGRGVISTLALPGYVGAIRDKVLNNPFEAVEAARALIPAFRANPAGMVGETVKAFTGQNIIEQVPGLDYQGHSPSARFAGTVGEFAPGAVVGPAGAARGVAARGVAAAANVLLPAAASSVAGNVGGAVGGDTGRVIGEVGGAIVGGGAAPGLARSVGQTVARMTNPDALTTAEQRVAQVIARQAQRTPGVTVESLQREAANAPSYARPYHLGEGALAPVADAIANAPGPGRRIITNAATASSDDIASGIRSDIRAFGGQGDYLETLDNMLTAKRTAANEGITTFGQEPVNLDSNTLKMLGSELVDSALRRQAQIDMASPEVAVREDGAFLLNLQDYIRANPDLGDGVKLLPVRQIQNLTARLNAAATSAYKTPGNGDAGKALSAVARSLRNSARTQHKGYDTWLTEYGDASDNEAALALGRGVFSSPTGVKQSAEAIGRELADMGPAAVDYYKKGVGEALLAQARSSQGDIGALRRLARTEEFAERIKFAFPSEDAFETFIRQASEKASADAISRSLSGNSASAMRLSTQADLSAQGIGPADVASGMADLLSPRQTVKNIIKSLPRKDRSVIGGEKTNEALGRAMADNEELQRILRGLPPRVPDWRLTGAYSGLLGFRPE